METVRLTEDNIEDAVRRAAHALASGGVVLYPTDTLYGLGADAFSDKAVAKVYAIKGRDEKKPIHCIVPDIETAEAYAEVNELARKLAEKFLPGPLTLVLKKRTNIDSGIAKNIGTIGLRIPQNNFCIELAKAFGPYTTTSANVAGGSDQRNVADILSQLGAHASLIDLVIDVGELPEREPSTVVDLSSGQLKVLREGAVPAKEIAAFQI
jgi:L-threonylcarbamoyladenylate synthase